MHYSRTTELLGVIEKTMDTHIKVTEQEQELHIIRV